MREDVLSLHAMGGDPVSEEYLKAELYHRAEALKDIPDTPLFFGRLDYAGPIVQIADLELAQYQPSVRDECGEHKSQIEGNDQP